MSKATNTIGYQPNWVNIAQLVQKGYIREVVHPDDPDLKLYNYTPKAQFEQHWTKDVLICRGLIARETPEGKVVIARPFPKFFNWQELAHLGKDISPIALPEGPWEVQEKYDGSLGIAYQFAPGDWRIATRGSFTSDQAVWATEQVKKHHYFTEWTPGLTYLMEIIYPENRIVVDYKGLNELVLLDILNTYTGDRVTETDTTSLPEWGFTHGSYYSIYDLPPEKPNTEGYVLVNDKGFRVKVKHDEYVRLHRIMTNTSSRTVWEYLSDPEKDFNELLDNVPDEFYDWVKETKADLEKQYFDIEFECQQVFLKIDVMICPETRKGYATLFKGQAYPSILFNMLDNKDYSGLIWKLIKPERVLPFHDSDKWDGFDEIYSHKN